MAVSDNTALLLTMSADLSQLKKKYSQDGAEIVNSGSVTMERRAKKAAETIEKSFLGINVGGALNKVFDSAKLTTLEAGSTKLRIFGSALEPLGPLGLGAAAGIVALGAALDQAHKAVEFADNIFTLAKNAHVTTDELQQMQFALRKSGGDASQASSGLQSFSETLGKASAGLPRALKGFQELFGKGFTAQDVKNLGDAGQALDAITEKIAQLKNPAQKDAVIAQLGLESLKPLIEGGVDKMRELRAEAEATGNVMDVHLVNRGHQLNEEIETATGKIKVEMAEAFINVGPILVKLLGLLAKMAEFAEHVAAALAPIQARGTADLVEQRAFIEKRSHDPVHRLLRGGRDDQKQIAAIDAELARRNASGEDKPPALPTGGAELADLTKTKKGPPDQTDNLTKTAKEDQQHALKALAEAYKNLTANVDARAKFETDANNAEAAAEQIKLAADLKKLLKDKTIDGKTSDILQAKIEEASANVELARVAKNDLVARNQRFADEARDDETRKELADAAISQLELALNLATTQAERNRIEREILTLKQQEALHLKATQLSNLEATGAITDEEGGKRFAAFLGAQKTERQQQVVAQEDPVQRYIKSVQDLNTVMKTAAVTAAHDLSVGLADAIVNAKNLGDVASSVFKQLIAQLLAAAIQKDIAAPFLAVLGLADGGRVNGPGTSTSDSIPAMLSAGEYVVNASAASKHGKLLEAINSGHIPRFAMGGPVPSLGPSFDALHTVSLPARPGGAVIVQQFHLHAEGALMTNEYTAKLQQQARAEANTAAAAALRTANKTFPALQRAFGLLGTT